MFSEAQGWKATVSIDDVAVQDINGNGNYVIDTGVITLNVAERNPFVVKPDKPHTFRGRFPAVLIQDLGVGKHTLQGKYVRTNGLTTTFTETITVG